MFKKYLIACSLVCITALLSEYLIFSAPVSEQRNVEKEAIYTRILERHQKAQFYASLNFADEPIPLDMKRVKTRLDRSIKKMSFHSIRTNRIHRIADRWLGVVEPILEKQGVPTDFKYIPLIESGFKSGTSEKGASGFWQFMPSTARAYGLVVNDELDEREDIYKSTLAAAKYIKAMYREFGSWTLAAAAYNIGEGNLRRSMIRQGEDNYFRLSLNKETASYVYKLISIKEVIEHPDKYGFGSSSSGAMLAEVTGSDSASNRL